MMVELDLNVVNKLWGFWLKGADETEDFLQTTHFPLTILRWQRQPRIETVMAAFSTVLNQLGSCIDFSCVLGNLMCSPFPYKPATINEWFTISSKRELREQDVNVINLDQNGKERRCYITQNRVRNFPESLSNNDYEIFFHGTRHDSARKIIESGIDVAKGGRKKDFSNGEGFYLGNNFEEAWNTRWATNRPPCSAVLIFRVRSTELRVERNSLGLQNDEARWQEVVRQFRSGRPERRFLRQLREYQFIEGPMSSISGENQSFEHPTFNRNTYQLCVRDDTCAQLFNRSLHSVVFFTQR